ICTVTFLLGFLIGAALFVASVQAIFGTVHPHAILNTHCFERRQTTAGQNNFYKLRPHCTVFRIHPDAGKVVGVGLVAFLLYLAVSAMLSVVALRAADRRFGSLREWPLIPSGGAVLRAIGRLLGWGLLSYAGLALGVVAVVLMFLAGGKAGPLGILIALALLVVALVWWLAPFAVHLLMAFTKMLVDDQGLIEAWKAIRVTLGQAWAIIGLGLLVSIGFSIAESIVRVAGNAGFVLSIPIQLAAYAVQLALAVALMRFLSGELSGDAAPDDGTVVS
ncbi:MAG TPA: hypothetical protein VFJ24_04110, partial [Gaiellales bacterium]|nr:hypothetical protein [Gaiellales bacterium]